MSKNGHCKGSEFENPPHHSQCEHFLWPKNVLPHFLMNVALVCTRTHYFAFPRLPIELKFHFSFPFLGTLRFNYTMARFILFFLFVVTFSSAQEPRAPWQRASHGSGGFVGSFRFLVAGYQQTHIEARYGHLRRLDQWNEYVKEHEDDVEGKRKR